MSLKKVHHTLGRGGVVAMHQPTVKLCLAELFLKAPNELLLFVFPVKVSEPKSRVS